LSENNSKYSKENINMSRISGRSRIRRSKGPVEKPKKFKETLKRLWYYFGKQRKLLLIVFFITIVDAIITLLVPYLIGRAIDTIPIDGKVNFKILKIILLALIISYFLDAVLTFFQGWLMAGTAQHIVKNMRADLFKKFQKLPIVFFDGNTHGEIMSRVSNDVDNVSSTISQSTTQLMSGMITIIGSLIMMIILSPLLTLASMITVPLVFLLTRIIAKNTNVLFKNQQKELGRLNAKIEEAISGIYVVKAFNHENREIQEFEEINNDLYKVSLRAQIWSGYLMPLMNVINNIGFAVVAGVGGILAVKNIVTIGIIASFLSYSRQFSRPLNDLASIFNTLQSAVAGAERVFDTLEEKNEDEDAVDATILHNPKGNVIFQNVSFGYRKDLKILKNINFKVKFGTSVALVGPTGAGKTTIVNLLTRFYDVSAGKIFIDNKDIREYTRDSLRRCFGMVLQDTYLFTGTIKENIRYGKLDAADDQIRRAAIMAKADDFIRDLPKGYDTLLFESGSNLSQGQRQLLAIARAILSNPSILILDEATSSIDTRTEMKIQQAMSKLMEGRTSFIIAHRLSTIKDADVIMVIDNGQIIEKGNHDELIEKKGFYYDMYLSQVNSMEN